MNAETSNAPVDVRGLVALAEQMERDADACRRDGYIDAAVVKEDCAQRIRQTLGISAIAEALAAEGVQAGGAEGELSHADLCRLSRVFNDHNELHLTQDRRINEWLGKRIASALSRQPEPKAEAQLTYKGVPIGPMHTFADIERQATVPVGVEGLIEAAKAAESMLRTVHECASHDCEDCREYAGIHAKHLRDALAQPPAAAQSAEIEALRAEVDESDVVLRVWRRRTAEAEARAERLAELLDQAYGYVPAGTLADQIHCALVRY